MPADRARIVGLLRALVATDSVNPGLAPGGAGEGAVATLLAAECRAAGLEVRLDEVAPGRPNVVARLAGARPGRRLLLCGHTDTVATTGMAEPFSARLEGDRLYGRGAYDMKGGVAAIVEAMRVVAAAGLPAGELVAAFVVDEEHASLGALDLIRRERADAAVITEPTALEVCIAHKGFLWARVETAGRAAHGSRYDAGDDAITRMGHVLVALDRLEREVLPQRTHPLLGRPSLHASTIAGGVGWSTYPDRCVLEVERRLLPGEQDADVLAELEAAVSEAQQRSPGLQARVELVMSRPSFEVSPEAPVVRALADSVRAVCGRSPRLVGEHPWFDAALLGAAGIPTVMFGPGGAGAHAAVEWVDVPSVVTCADVLAHLASHWCAA
ncbi:MAG: M20/M25/M40 family metallo-hydrolase [Armatimonadota bacterium]|nr:M20/M25/M40 family metallo-hydrolase [Armatimonadota bacterium]